MPVQQFDSSSEQHNVVNKVIDQVSKSTVLNRDHLQAIEWSLNEITDNVLNHSESSSGGFVQSTIYSDSNSVEFLVADGGIGIPKSLKIKEDKLALERAITEGVTRNKKTNQGNGLYGVYRIALVTNGQFNLQSYFGNMYVDQGTVKFRDEKTPYSGTFVRWSISLKSEDIISRALIINGQPREIIYDYLDQITDPQRGTVSIVMKNEFTSFGSRAAGRLAYNKIKNHLNWGNSETLEVDFTGINIISSSFADEVFGRIFAEMGPMIFMSRVKFVGSTSEILGIVDRAMRKRFAQG